MANDVTVSCDSGKCVNGQPHHCSKKQTTVNRMSQQSAPPYRPVGRKASSSIKQNPLLHQQGPMHPQHVMWHDPCTKTLLKTSSTFL